MIRIERSAAIGAISWLDSSMTGRTRTGSTERLRSPDSIRAMSMSSLISASRWRPAPSIRSTPSLSSSLRSDICRSWVKPRMEFSGVRSSWLVLDRNEFFAWVAFIAASLAVVSSAARLASSSSALRCDSATRPISSAAWENWFERLSLAQPARVLRVRADPAGDARGEQGDAGQPGEQRQRQAGDVEQFNPRLQRGDVDVLDGDQGRCAARRGWRPGGAAGPWLFSRFSAGRRFSAVMPRLMAAA